MELARGSCVLTLLWCHALLKPRSGISPKDIEADFRNGARDEVRSFTRLKLDGVDVGLNMLRDLEKHPDGIEKVVGDNCYEPREIAAEIRSKNARYFLLPKCTGKPLKSFWLSRETQQECKHTPTADSAS